MFKISKNPIVTVPVPFFVNGEDQSFTATFEILPSARIQPGALDTDEAQTTLLVDATKDIGDLVGDDEQPLTFSRDVLDAVIGRFDSRQAMLTAYMEACQETIRGNSHGLPAHGSTAA
jgi:hypothetical protein